MNESDVESVQSTLQNSKVKPASLFVSPVDHKKYSVAKFLTHAASKNQLYYLLGTKGKITYTDFLI